MNGFGFLEYEDPLDARDVVPGTLLAPTSFQVNADTFSRHAYESPSSSHYCLSDNDIDGTDFKGQRLTVQFARGPRDRDHRAGPPPGAPPPYGERGAPRTRRTVYRMNMAGLPPETSWQVSGYYTFG